MWDYSTRLSRVEVWFRFVRFALLLVVVLCWVARCFGSWVLLGLFCLLHVTPPVRRDLAERRRNLGRACTPYPSTAQYALGNSWLKLVRVVTKE